MADSKGYTVQDVFTPTKPARYTFVERESINDKLVPALRTPGKQIVVYGHSGSGKTTLLVNKLHQIYEEHITTRCISGLTFDQLLLDAFDQLGNYFDSEKIRTKKRVISPSLETEYLGIKAKIGFERSDDSTTKQQRILPPQLTPQTLARLLGEAHCCWLLEDFHKIEPHEKKRLAQVMKVFMDMSDQYNDLKIIALGAVGTARQVVEYDPEMRNRISEIYVPLMTPDEIRLIPQKGERFLNIHIEENVKDNIVKYSSGLASVCHQLCLNMCFAADVDITLQKQRTFDIDILNKAIEQYLDESSDTLKSAFDKAFRQFEKTKYDDVKLVIGALLQVDQDGAIRPTLQDKIREKEHRYPAKNLIETLKRLQEPEKGSIISFDPASGRYSFTDPFYRAFALALMEKEESKSDKYYVVTSFDDTWVKHFQTRIIREGILIEHLSYSPVKEEKNEEPVHRMNWQDKFFTGKRKHGNWRK